MFWLTVIEVLQIEASAKSCAHQLDFKLQKREIQNISSTFFFFKWALSNKRKTQFISDPHPHCIISRVTLSISSIFGLNAGN